MGARLGGRGVALRPLRTWNGEGASGEEVRQGPEGEPLSQGPGRSVLGPRGSKSQAGQGGDLVGVQTAVTWKTKQMGRRGRLPSRENGASGDIAPGPSWTVVVWQ